MTGWFVALASLIYGISVTAAAGWRSPGLAALEWGLIVLSVLWAWVATFVPRLRVTRESFKLPLRPPVPWSAVTEFLPRRSSRSFMRVAYKSSQGSKRVELYGVGPELAEALHELVPRAQNPG